MRMSQLLIRDMISDYYPMGADTPEAPWNQVGQEEKQFNLTVSQTLSKTVSVLTEDYVPIHTLEPWNGINETSIDTSDTNWSDVYAENDYHTPQQLILLFKRYLQDELNHTDIAIKNPEHLKYLIEECDNWIVDEEEFIQDGN